jgi:hypothetical protein
MVRIALPFFALLFCASCSKTLIASRAPNHASTVRIKQLCFLPDCVVEVTLQKGLFDERIIAVRSDCIVNFAHIAWSPDSRLAAIFVDNSLCSNIQEVWDVSTSSTRPFAPMADRVRRSIVREYGLKPGDLEPYGGDPLEWARYPGDGSPRPGIEVFRKKYGPDRP